MSPPPCGEGFRVGCEASLKTTFWRPPAAEGQGLKRRRRGYRQLPRPASPAWPRLGDRLATVGRIVDLQERLDLRHPAVAHKGDVVGMVIVAVIGGLVGELHGEAEAIVVLRAHLCQPLELLD